MNVPESRQIAAFLIEGIIDGKYFINPADYDSRSAVSQERARQKRFRQFARWLLEKFKETEYYRGYLETAARSSRFEFIQEGEDWKLRYIAGQNYPSEILPAVFYFLVKYLTLVGGFRTGKLTSAVYNVQCPWCSMKNAITEPHFYMECCHCFSDFRFPVNEVRYGEVIKQEEEDEQR